jgi:hypothetical protein
MSFGPCCRRCQSPSRSPKRAPKRAGKTPAKATPARTRQQVPKPTSNGSTTDKKRQAQAAKAPAKAKRKPIDPKLAQRAVTMRGKLDGKGKPASWAKIGYALKLVPEGAPKSQAGDAARRAYRQIKGHYRTLVTVPNRVSRVAYRIVRCG